MDTVEATCFAGERQDDERDKSEGNHEGRAGPGRECRAEDAALRLNLPGAERTRGFLAPATGTLTSSWTLLMRFRITSCHARQGQTVEGGSDGEESEIEESREARNNEGSEVAFRTSRSSCD